MRQTILITLALLISAALADELLRGQGLTVAPLPEPDPPSAMIPPADADVSDHVKALLDAWGLCESEWCPYDLTGDGEVGAADLAALLAGERPDAQPPGAAATLPIQGRPVSEFAFLDALIVSWMDFINADAAVVGIMHDDTIVYLRGFGWLDDDDPAPMTETSAVAGTPMPETAMVRIASVIKPITAAAIRELISDPIIDLELDDKAFNVGQPGGGVLNLQPWGELGDSRLGEITIHQMLQHFAGWDRGAPHTPEDWDAWDNSEDKDGNRWDLYCADPNAYDEDDGFTSGDRVRDHTIKNCVIADDMEDVIEDDEYGLPNQEEIVRWILGQPLICDPGTRQTYSNEGYVTLGVIIEQLAPQGYMQFLRDRILTPAIEVPEMEVAEARTRRDDAMADVPDGSPFREPWYLDTGCSSCDVLSLCSSGLLNRSYGSNHLEARLAHGGVKASASALLRFANTYRIGLWSSNIGVPLDEAPLSNTQLHGGDQPGVATQLWQRPDGARLFVFINRNESHAKPSNLYDGSGDFESVSYPPDWCDGDGNCGLQRYLDNLTAGDNWPTMNVEGFWTAAEGYGSGGYGGYNQPFASVDAALSFSSEGTRIRMLPGSANWTGTIDTPLTIDAPLGTATIGQ